MELPDNPRIKVVPKLQHCDIDRQLSDHERPRRSKDRVYEKVSVKKYCIVMDKLGESLFNLNELFLNKLSLQTIIQIGI